MSQTFPLNSKSSLGYETDEVEKFLSDARDAYEAQSAGIPVDIDSKVIRQMSFSMQKGGYSTVHVDAALERLEDAFSARERALAMQQLGTEEWYELSREKAREVVARLERPRHQKFRGAGFLTGGYHRDDVDLFCDTLASYFRDGAKVKIEDVRAVVFRPKLGGYSEPQVDLLIDAVIDVMLAVRS